MNWRKLLPSKKVSYGPLYDALAEDGLEWVFWLLLIGGIAIIIFLRILFA